MANETENTNTFLGRGWTFPPTFFKDTSGGGVSEAGIDYYDLNPATTGKAGVYMAEGVEDINMSLEVLFSTALGERVMLPEYGGDLHDMMFEGIDIGLLTRIKDRVRKAIIYFEPRIKLDGVKTLVTDSEGVIMLVIEYTIISTNTRNNLVYPFYLTEATDTDL